MRLTVLALLMTIPVSMLSPTASAATFTNSVTACPTTGSATGCATATMTANAYACSLNGDGVVRCPVEYRLMLYVNGVLTCGSAWSSKTPSLSACAIVGSASAGPANGWENVAPGAYSVTFGVCAWVDGAPSTTSCRSAVLVWGTPGVNLALIPPGTLPPEFYTQYNGAADSANSVLGSIYGNLP